MGIHDCYQITTKRKVWNNLGMHSASETRRPSLAELIHRMSPVCAYIKTTVIWAAPGSDIFRRTNSAVLWQCPVCIHTPPTTRLVMAGVCRIQMTFFLILRRHHTVAEASSYQTCSRVSNKKCFLPSGFRTNRTKHRARIGIHYLFVGRDHLMETFRHLRSIVSDMCPSRITYCRWCLFLTISRNDIASGPANNVSVHILVYDFKWWKV